MQFVLEDNNMRLYMQNIHRSVSVQQCCFNVFYALVKNHSSYNVGNN